MAGLAVATTLAAIPWDKVIKYGPQIADAAKALWSSVKSDTPTVATAEETLGSRIDQLTTETNELHDQMLAASEIIARVASQNAQLTKRVTLLTYVCSASIVLSIVAIGVRLT